MALQKAKLGPDHPDTLRSTHLLAVRYNNIGRYVEAAKLLEDTLPLQKSKLGAGHGDTLLSIMTLAYSYAALGRYAESAKLVGETLDTKIESAIEAETEGKR